jgi:hypothetical protein
MIAVINFIENSVKESAKRMDEPYVAGGRRKPSVPASAAASGLGSLCDDAARKQGVAALPAQLFGERLLTMNRLAAVLAQVTATSMPCGSRRTGQLFRVHRQMAHSQGNCRGQPIV